MWVNMLMMLKQDYGEKVSILINTIQMKMKKNKDSINTY